MTFESASENAFIIVPGLVEDEDEDEDEMNSIRKVGTRRRNIRKRRRGEWLRQVQGWSVWLELVDNVLVFLLK